MSQTFLEMAKDLVLAQIQAHKLSPEEMHTALQHTYTSLLALKAQEDANGSSAGEGRGCFTPNKRIAIPLYRFNPSGSFCPSLSP